MAVERSSAVMGSLTEREEGYGREELMRERKMKGRDNANERGRDCV